MKLAILFIAAFALFLGAAALISIICLWQYPWVKQSEWHWLYIITNKYALAVAWHHSVIWPHFAFALFASSLITAFVAKEVG
jgi:hypothetical protein